MLVLTRMRFGGVVSMVVTPICQIWHARRENLGKTLQELTPGNYPALNTAVVRNVRQFFIL